MVDKEVLKRIEIYNCIYGYVQGDMNYFMQVVFYKMKLGVVFDVIIDNFWVIDVYNFQIYSKNNNCILSIMNNVGNGFIVNIKDYIIFKGVNVYVYIWNLMWEVFSEIIVYLDGGIFREISYQLQMVNYGVSYIENFFWKVFVFVLFIKLEDKFWEVFKVLFGKELFIEVFYKIKLMDYFCKGQFGNGLYSKFWQFIFGEFYDRVEVFVYEMSQGLCWIDVV